jgi:copper homeostasis protein
MNSDLILEVCVDSVESAVAAEQGGAQRVELCSNLLDGGVTPSSGLIATVRSRISIGLQVMIRPRGGDFDYSDDEFQIMQRDIVTAKQLGADGVVLGILNMDGRVDSGRTRRLVDLAAPLKVTYHRAFDMSSDLFLALEDLHATGVNTILTSGGKPTAIEGADILRRLVESSNGSVAIMAGGGIEDHNVGSLIEQTGVREIHASLKFPVPSSMRFQNREISMGTLEGREYERFVVRPDKVQKLLYAALHRVSKIREGNVARSETGTKTISREGPASGSN